MKIISTITKSPNLKYVIFACCLLAVGLYGIGMVFFYGQESSYGVSREVPLGLLLIGYAFFVGISVGLSVIATLAHVFKFESLHYRARQIALLSFAALISAFFLIFWELGGPFQLQVLRFIVYYANFQIASPIWWMSTFYVFETPLLALELYLLIKNNEKATFWAGIVGFVLGLLAFSTLSMVFAVNEARPIWHTAGFSISFVLGAMVCGLSFLMMFMRFRIKQIQDKTVFAISNALVLFLVGISFVHLYTAVISLYGTGGYLAKNVAVLYNGPMSFNYYVMEILVGIIIPLALIIKGKFKNATLSAIAAIFIVVGAFFGRFDSVVSGQLVRVESEFIPNLALASYIPSMAEISIFVSGFGLMMLIFELGNIFFKLDDGEQK